MGRNFNTRNTKFIITRNLYEFANSDIIFNVELYNRVDKIKCMETWLFENTTYDKEIKKHIVQARQIFLKFRNLFICSEFNIVLR